MRLQKELESLPAGKLSITRCHTRYKWYINTGEQMTYLPKSDKMLAEQLARRKYITLYLKELNHEKLLIQSYQKKHFECSSKSEQLLISDAYHDLLAPFFTPRSQELHNWYTAQYEHNLKYPEQLIHRSLSGNCVRSKSEAFIDSALFKKHIPYRYECALILDDLVYYPDFTILHPQTQKIYYWEHFGMMDNQNYARNAYSKLQTYHSYNINEFTNLITTYETSENPLSIDLVEKIIDHYFC